MSKQIDDPSQARYLRRQYNLKGYDDEEQQQDNQFKRDLEKAIQNHQKKTITQKNIQNQVKYFGSIIEPFNMRKEEQMGNIDEDGFFVFNKRKRGRDAWLESIDQAEDEQIAQKIRKQINTGGRYLSVNEVQNKMDQVQDVNSDQQQSHSQKQQKEQQMIEKKSQSNQSSEKFKPQQIIQLLVSLLPDNLSANQYLKKLKKEKNTQLYDKIILLCNQYIQATTDHEILTKKKQQLIIGQQEQEQLEWDNQKSVSNKQNNQADEDEDNIF